MFLFSLHRLELIWSSSIWFTIFNFSSIFIVLASVFTSFRSSSSSITFASSSLSASFCSPLSFSCPLCSECRLLPFIFYFCWLLLILVALLSLLSFLFCPIDTLWQFLFSASAPLPTSSLIFELPVNYSTTSSFSLSFSDLTLNFGESRYIS